MENINLLKQQEQLDSRHAKTMATPIYETVAHIKFKLHMHRKYHRRNINNCKRMTTLWRSAEKMKWVVVLRGGVVSSRDLITFQPPTSDIRNDNQL